MRRALRTRLPALSLHYGLLPWQLADLSFGEIDAYLTHLNQLEKRAQEQQLTTTGRRTARARA